MHPQTPPQNAFRGSNYLLTRYLEDFGRLGMYPKWETKKKCTFRSGFSPWSCRVRGSISRLGFFHPAPEIRAYYGLVNHWFPLLRLYLNPYFWGGHVRGGVQVGPAMNFHGDLPCLKYWRMDHHPKTFRFSQWKPLASMDLCQEVWHIWQRPNWLNRWARMAQTQDGQSWPQHWMAKKRSGGWPSGLSAPTFCWHRNRHPLAVHPLQEWSPWRFQSWVKDIQIGFSCLLTNVPVVIKQMLDPPLDASHLSIASYLVSDNCDMPHICFPCQPVTFRHCTLWGHLGNHPCLKPVILQLPKNQQPATNTPHQLMIRMFLSI